MAPSLGLLYDAYIKPYPWVNDHPIFGKIITALINAHSPHRHPNGLIVWSQCFRVSIVVSEIWLKHVKTCYPLVFLHSYGKWPMYR